MARTSMRAKMDAYDTAYTAAVGNLSRAIQMLPESVRITVNGFGTYVITEAHVSDGLVWGTYKSREGYTARYVMQSAEERKLLDATGITFPKRADYGL